MELAGSRQGISAYIDAVISFHTEPASQLLDSFQFKARIIKIVDNDPNLLTIKNSCVLFVCMLCDVWLNLPIEPHH